jgi:hypothetical protein
MNDTREVTPDEQFELLLEKNRELIDALKNLRKRLGGETPDRSVEDTVVVEAEGTGEKEEQR